MPRVRDYQTEYQRRIARGLARGLSRSKARGHPKAREKHASGKAPKPLDDRQLQIGLRELRRGRGVKAAARQIGVSPERLKHQIATIKVAKKKKGRWVVRS